MIGIFGMRRAERDAPADLGGLVATLPDRLKIGQSQGTGGAVGCAAHAHGLPIGRATAAQGAIEVAMTGPIFNLRDFEEECPRVASPAQLIAQLYLDGALRHLAKANGQFAAAIYDDRHHRLTLITDRLCTTAVHVWRQGGEITFATHLFTLLGDRRIARKANHAAIAQLFTMQRTIGETDPIAGVVSLPAGCVASFDDSGETRQRYWELTWRRGSFSEDEGAELLVDALRGAVKRQSIGAHNALLLSGGIDSRLVLAAAERGSLSCWTTASYAENPELALAKRMAEMFGAEHRALVIEPSDTLISHDNTVVESGGLYPSSNAMSSFLPQVGGASDVILTGHGIDYTLRGYYLPTRFAEVFGSRTRIPTLAPIPARPTGSAVLGLLRQGPPRRTVERIIAPGRAPEWWRGQEEAMGRALRPWLDSDEPYNAWDAFILHAVNKHYAFTSMMAVRAVGDLAVPAFDDQVLAVYLAMPPTWRVTGRLVQKALRRLSPEAARLPNANTHFRADLAPWLEVAALLGRAGLRRIGLAARPSVPSALHSPGSWQNMTMLYRCDPGHRQRFLEIRGRLDALSFGILDTDGLAACIDEHLEGRAAHVKLLRQLLTHDAWVRRFGIEGHG